MLQSFSVGQKSVAPLGEGGGVGGGGDGLGDGGGGDGPGGVGPLLLPALQSLDGTFDGHPLFR